MTGPLIVTGLIEVITRCIGGIIARVERVTTLQAHNGTVLIGWVIKTEWSENRKALILEALLLIQWKDLPSRRVTGDQNRRLQ